MRFFVVERRSSDRTLSVVLDTAYPTRDDAVAALTSSVASGDVTPEGEVFIVDLDVALPVLIVAPGAPAVAEVSGVEPTAPVEAEPAAEAADIEATDEPATSDVAAADADVMDEETAATLYAPVEPAPAELAEALQRAAWSLEGEGIVAPESVQPEADVPEVVTGEAVVDDVASLLAGLSAGQDPEPADEAAGTQDVPAWPWANVDAYVSAGDDEQAAPEAAGHTETMQAPDEGAIITSAPPEGEDAYLPRPVILGDYADDVTPAAEAVSATVAEPMGVIDIPGVDAPAAEPVEEAGLPGDSAAASEQVPELDGPAGAPAVEAAPGEQEADILEYVDLGAISVEAVAYEATGAIDLGAYTCQDCVYANTCPKVGQSAPADCGSFQWRSE